METNGAHEQPGTALLLAAAPTGKGRLIDASSVIPVLAAVPPAALAGTATATLIELADPADPQALLTRIRGAAATGGPLTVVLVGQLQLDRRQQGVHLALARTTSATIRYTAFPWAWLVQELQQRRPDTTTLYVDLIADAEVWQLLDETGLALPGGAHAYGVIAPPPSRRRVAHPRYTHALAQILRTGQRLTADQLHEEVLRRATAVEGAIVLGPERPAAPMNAALPSARPAAAPAAPPAPAQPQVPMQAYASPPPPAAAAAKLPPPPPPQTQRSASPVIRVEADPHQQIAALSRAGRHQEAVALAVAAEQRAVQALGGGTFAALHWIEVRAHLASVAHDPVQSCTLWIQAAQTRLDTLQQAPDARDVEGAVDRAHHQWDRIRDAAQARRHGPHLVALRRRVPGRQRGALDALQKKVERLNNL